MSYFNEYSTEKCGICDICTSTLATKMTNATISSKILLLLKKRHQLTSRELVSLLEIEKNDVINSLQLLLDTNKITITSQHKFELKQ